jgi:hypothetical protein
VQVLELPFEADLQRHHLGTAIEQDSHHFGDGVGRDYFGRVPCGEVGDERFHRGPQIGWERGDLSKGLMHSLSAYQGEQTLQLMRYLGGEVNEGAPVPVFCDGSVALLDTEPFNLDAAPHRHQVTAMLSEHERGNLRSVNAMGVGEFPSETQGVRVGAYANNAMSADCAREHLDSQFNGAGLHQNEWRWAAPSSKFIGEVGEHRMVDAAQSKSIRFGSGSGGHGGPGENNHEVRVEIGGLIDQFDRGGVVSERIT